MKLDEVGSVKVRMSSGPIGSYGDFHTVELRVYSKPNDLGTLMEDTLTLETLASGTARSKDLAIAIAFNNLSDYYRNQYRKKTTEVKND
jgi:hypothetical protein